MPDNGTLHIYADGAQTPVWAHQAGDGTTSRELVARPEFYIAHRGSGGNWPEHTYTSYVSAAWWGMPAIEVSVHLSADGELVCFHDFDLSRLTGVAATVVSKTWAELSALSISAKETDNTIQPAAPFTRLRDVLDLLLRDDPHVLFLEPKSSDAADPLLAMLTEYPNAADYVVWKRWITDPYFTAAKDAGYLTWGYVLDETSHFAAVDDLDNRSDLDMVGVSHLMDDLRVGPIVSKATAAGKPSIMWEIGSIAVRDRARALGVRGFMTQNIRAVVPHRSATA